MRQKPPGESGAASLAFPAPICVFLTSEGGFEIAVGALESQNPPQ